MGLLCSVLKLDCYCNSIVSIIIFKAPTIFKQNLETVYFAYPDLQSRLFLATFGHFIFTVGYTLYSLLSFVQPLVSRVIRNFFLFNTCDIQVIILFCQLGVS
ncbi:hypothetical protein Hanom_Chr16g01472231 [Helianthus anomalus]